MNEKLGVYEELDSRIRQLMMDSKDPEYTDYLRKMYNRLIQQKYQVDLIKSELDRSYTLYVDRMQKRHVVEEKVVAPVIGNAEPMPYVPVAKKKSNTEFTVGAAVLSIIGGGFILAALVTLGMTLMGGIFKGICLYAVALTFLFVSELFVSRKLPMLGATLSSIGIGGLYLSTAINYLALHNFNLWVTLGVTLVITLGVILLSRKKDSALFRTIGMIAGYLSFFVVKAGITEAEFLVISGMILLMNVLCILFPVRKSRTAINISHMCVNTFFAICFVLKAELGCGLAELPVLIFVISSVLVLHILYVAQFNHYRKTDNMSYYAGVVCAYYFSLICYFFMMCVLANSRITNWYAYNSAIALCVIGLVTICALAAKKCSGQGHVYAFINLSAFLLVGCAGGGWVYTICLLILLVLAKLICFKTDTAIFRVVDLSITVLLCFDLMIREGPHAYLIMAGMLLSILLMKYWQTFYEILLTASIVLYMITFLPTIIKLPVIVGTMLVGILIFNSVKRWKDKYIIVFNRYALIVQGICFLGLSGFVYRNEYITYLCMLVFGLATIILTFQEKYRMNFKSKYLILAIFLTYMAFILRTDIPVINSILLMIIALVCVGIGFGMNTKNVRIYGLVLALVVCGKLVLYDFFGAATIQKTILFFVVGVIALTIAAIYIILEKRNNS